MCDTGFMISIQLPALEESLMQLREVSDFSVQKVLDSYHDKVPFSSVCMLSLGQAVRVGGGCVIWSRAVRLWWLRGRLSCFFFASFVPHHLYLISMGSSHRQCHDAKLEGICG